MAGIGTAARNWKEEEQQGIGTPAYHEPAGSISTPAYKEPAGSISTPASTKPASGISTPASKPATGTNDQKSYYLDVPTVKPMETVPYVGTSQESTATKPISVMEGVSESTRNKLNGLQGGYQPGAAAQSVQQQLQQLQANKPGGYTSQYDGQLQSILAEIQGQKPFQYSFSGDALFNSLKDIWTEQARQASMGAQAQAAALTGGYGNSAAQMAGSQAYQQNILPLYDKATELARLAYDVHQGEQADKYNQLSALLNLDQKDYGRHRDTVTDFKDERDYLTGRYDTEEERAYDRYKDDINYWTGLAEIENKDYRSEQERQEAIRQYNQNYARGVYESDRDYGRGVYESDRDYAMDVNRYNRGIYESDRDYGRGVYESDRDYNRGVLESDRNYDRSVLESDRDYNRGVLESDRDYDRNVLESDRNYKLSQEELQEKIRQFDESLNWDRMSDQQQRAMQLVLQILASGKMPTDDMLTDAGLSTEDAGLLMAKPTGTGNTGGQKIYYTDASGNYYTLNNGKYTQVDASKVPNSAKVDTSRAGDIMLQNTGTAIGNTVNSITQPIQGTVDNILKLLGL